MKTSLILSGIVALLFFAATPTFAATLYSQTINLQTGWNIVSTPKVLDSHSFSVAENSTNFDVYALDPSKPSGWATLADLGQSEFTPLHGYFINNKTGIVQTLVFNYKSDTTPNQRLFERVFQTTGWYSFGVANSSYSLSVNSATTTDSNNPADILSALVVGNSKYDSVVDFTHASSANINSVAVIDPWKLVVQSAVNTLNDFRETKGYAIYIKQAGALYTGVQNNTVPTLAQCADGIDNDGDNFVDYPIDSACTSLIDTDESPFNHPGSLIVGLSASPISQTITPGGSSLLMANISLDATQSGEDLRISSVPARLTIGGGAASTELTACQLFDGATALNTGSNTVNPTGASPSDNTFTLDNPVTITKGTVKTLGVKCNVSGSATNGGTFVWSPGAAAFVTNFSVTAIASGMTIAATNGVGTAPTFTIGPTGSLVISTDASTPSYKLVAANAIGSTNLVAKVRAIDENVILTKVGLRLSNTASSTAADLTAVTIWDGATQVGSAVFSSGSAVATSTLTTPVTLTKNNDKLLTIRANFAAIGTGEPVTFSGRLVAIDIVDTEGVGVQSGGTIYSTYITPNTSLTASNGTRVFKSFPTIALVTLSPSGFADGRLMRFRVTADAAGPVGITQFGINVATTTASLTNISIFGFEDSSYSTAISGVSASGNLQATDDCATGCTSVSPNLTIGVTTSGGTATAIQVPAGATRYFEVRASVSGSTTGASVTTRLLGQTAFVTGAVSAVTTNPLVNAAGLGATDFVWSPNSTSTAVRADQDWTNGFGVAGLPSGGLVTTRSH